MASLKKIIFITLIINFGISGLALAHDPNSVNPFWMPGERLVPCGNTAPEDFMGPLREDQQPCDQCQILHLVRHVIDFLMIVATPILATLFFLYAGVLLMMGGANPGMLSQGKGIFKNTFIGLLIVMLAWLGTNILLKSLANYTIIGNKTGIANLQWYEFTCNQVF